MKYGKKKGALQKRYSLYTENQITIELFLSFMQFLNDIIDLIDASIKDDADILITGGNIIKEGYNSEIDTAKNIVSKSHEWISEYQKKLSEDLGISTLKIKFTNNSGYFIEIPRSQTSKIPDSFIQKQTLTQASRYITDQLQKFETELLSASDILYTLEYNEFIKVRSIVEEQFGNIYNISRKVASLDFYANGANISTSKGYSRPELSSKYSLEIIEGKHPVISEKQNDFISNNISMDTKEYIHVITGPNMGGKSTFLRQNALLILLAHIGYDIPCKKATISLVDKIFSRVGAGDNLYLGQSTFMVEMQEVSYILRNATKNSFVIIDEIGRGTSTYDGMSLAWAILKHHHNEIKAKTLFATHYHEIIDHANELKAVANFSVAVGENSDNLVFLRKIIRGGIKKSYGIEVAKLAGIPQQVLDQAKIMMTDLQSNNDFHQLSFQVLEDTQPEIQENIYMNIITDIENIDIDNISPLKSLQILSQIQEQVKKTK